MKNLKVGIDFEFKSEVRMGDVMLHCFPAYDIPGLKKKIEAFKELYGRLPELYLGEGIKNEWKYKSYDGYVFTYFLHTSVYVKGMDLREIGRKYFKMSDRNIYVDIREGEGSVCFY